MFRTLLTVFSIAMLTLCACKSAPPKPTTNLIDAAKGGDIEQLKSHFHWGCDVNEPDEEGMTPLHWAAKNGNIKAVELLLAKGALVNELNRKEESPLYLAESAGHAGVVEVLTAKGGKSLKPPLDPAVEMLAHVEEMMKIIRINKEDCNKIVEELKTYVGSQRKKFEELSKRMTEMEKKMTPGEKRAYTVKMMKRMEPVLKENMSLMMDISQKCPEQMAAIGQVMQAIK